MDEITVVTMTWWQLALFTGFVFFYGAFMYEILPIFLKRFADKLEKKIKENEKL